MQRTKAVWQLSGGPASRSFADVFLKYGVGLIGPGDAGRWVPSRNDDEFGGAYVRRFASQVNVGDIFLLRTGLSRISAVGLVASEYDYLNQFDDVNGWDLQHARRVRWCPLPQEYDFGAPVFGANPPRLSRVWNQEVTKYAQAFVNSPPTDWQTAPLPTLPEEDVPLDEIPDELQGLVAQARDFAMLLWDRHAFGDHPSEDELIAHFVIPFFRLLGWPPERIGVKWHNIDVALFRDLPRTPENCHLVIEAKRFGAGIEGALEQAKSYVEMLGVPRDIVVTDGIRYRLYSSKNGFLPVAYANLSNLKQSAAELFSKLRRPC